MIDALLYLKLTSFRNIVRTRVRQLRKPRYLLGALMAALYFGGLFSARTFSGAPHGRASHSDLELGESVASAILFLFLVMAWIFPSDRAAIAFTEAEVAYLFPAPVSRRTLLHYKILGSQAQILLSAFIIVIVSGRATQPGGWLHFVGWWLALVTLRLHAIGASFARTLLMDRGISNARRRIAVVALLVAVLGYTWWARKTPLEIDPRLSDTEKTFASVEAWWVSVADSWLLVPCRWVVRPSLATDFGQLWRAAIPALAVIGALYAWILRADVAFEEASIEQSRKLAERIAQIRAGRGFQRKHKGRKPFFKLSGVGPAPVGLLWKNLFPALTPDVLTLVRLSPLLVVGVVVVITRTHVTSLVVAPVLIAALFASFLLAPQVLRADLRTDLEMIDQLKVLPVAAWQIILGELLAPVLLISALQWALVIALLFVQLPSGRVPVPRFEIAAAVAIVAPTLNFMLFLVPNAGALLFPSWTNSARNPGLEQVGQRMLTMVATLALMLVAFLPATIAGGVSWLVLQFLGLHSAAIPLVGIVVAVVLAGEGAVGVLLLGWRFEKFDLSSEQRS